ncbi:MAG: hypothetical protein IJ998_05165 [Alistipes sp.]|nr:hypothetical protein [Alistipes sp.]
METIKALLNELRRCEIFNDYKTNYSYNDISLEETSAAFQKRLHRLYEDALLEIPFLSTEAKEGFVNIIDRYAESQRLFDVPDETILVSMNREIEAGNTNKSLRQERDFVKMICDCVSLQKYYLNEFAAAIGYTSTEQVVTATDETPVEETSIGNDNIISGVRGLAARLSCSIGTAQKIVNCGILKQRGIQYMVADNWKFDNKKLTKLLQEEPEILGLRTKK